MIDVSTAGSAALFGLDEPICPYTGLRTFTEEEAIYFRGRKSHVAKCLALLVEQRFVMITGASGDGKSSLVFAGMLPEVRAGFVPGRYSRWAVATFRPERSPLYNLAQALARTLGLPDSSAVETELEQGFSALVQLYQASALCPPPAPSEGSAPVEPQQRQAANLLLVVDQFEEFFTNPENYEGDVPGTAAQTVVNLLLETTRLAQAQNLPIYIVCTMRSDFVGQCAEFKGLIEQVGASQYFVPRLLRHEFLEVIKEPAVLSGNRISERLVQRLLYDIGQGQDQLPVLQHALRRIWLAADHGREEMDLIHYAMVGGLSGALPAAERARFAAWQATLPAHQQQFLLGNPGLRNVLDAHANQLYFEANELYNRDFEPPLPPGTAERVIEQTFRVLTRTDGKRVVRNRVTGAQITPILDDAALPWPVVCRLLRPFRAEGTTFLSPFLGEGDDGHAVLPPEAVLDISHESLIRNWGKLAEWAQLEAKDVRIANDFKQQAGRWLESGESKGYLLPIGLYNVFSGWYRSKNGADGWLAYYQRTNPDASLGPGPVATQVGTLTRYLAASRRYLWSQLLAARYGVWRLTALVLLPLLLLGAGWRWWSQRQLQSDYVAGKLLQREREELLEAAEMAKNQPQDRQQIRALLFRISDLAAITQKTQTEPTAEANKLISQFQKKLLAQTSAELPVKETARFILNADRLKNVVYRPWFSARSGTDYDFSRTLDALADQPLALDIELNMFALVDNMQYEWAEKEHPYLQPILRDLVLRLARADAVARPAASAVGASPSERQRQVAVFTARTIMALSYYLAYHTPHTGGQPEFENSKRQLVQTLRRYVEQEVRAKAGVAPSPVPFGLCLRVLLGQGNSTPAELAFLAELSPLNPASAGQFNRFFPPMLGLYTHVGFAQYSVTPGGGGHLTMAMAFAALRQPAKVLQCLNLLRAAAVAFQKAHPVQINPYDQKPVPRNFLLDTTNANSSLALLPYLVKYGLLDGANTHQLLAKCAQASGLPFNKVYAATVYNLLTVKPVPAVFDVSQKVSVASSAALLAAPPEGVALAYLNADRTSFSIPAAMRDKAWTGLLGATKEIAVREAVFTDDREHRDATSATYAVRRDELFLNAYLAKMHGLYLHEIKCQPQSFADFDFALQALQQHLRRNAGNGPQAQAISAVDWGLDAPEIQTLDPVAFLRAPGQPATSDYLTLAMRAQYTCSFDAFFLHELRSEAQREQRDGAVVHLLDSVAFREGFYPYPNLAWIRAIATTNVRGDAARRQRNALFWRVEEAVHNRRKLTDTLFSHRLVTTALVSKRQYEKYLARLQESGDMRQFVQGFYYEAAIDKAFDALAVALARSGQVGAAFALVDSVYANTPPGFDVASTTPVKIRISEQAMLTNNQRERPVLDRFLLKYLKSVHAGVAPGGNAFDVADNVLNVSASILPVCFWRPFAPASQLDTIAIIAPSLTYRLNDEPLNIGLSAPFKAYGLADKVYEANAEVSKSPFQLGFIRHMNINYLLLGYAHLKTSAPADGWHEYDEAELTLPADYNGYSRCN